MKKLLLTLTGAALACTPMLGAVTIDDLAGKTVGGLLFGNAVQNDAPNVNFGGYFEKTGSNTLVLKHFMQGYDLEFTFNNGVLTLANQSGKQGYGVKEGWSMTLTTMNETVQAFDYYGLYCYQNTDVTSQNSSQPAEGTGIIGYSFTQCPLLITQNTSQGPGYIISDSLWLYVYDTNATAKEYVGSELSDEYGVNMVFKGDNTFTIANWANQGIGFGNTGTTWSTINYENKVLHLTYPGTYDDENWTLKLTNDYVGSADARTYMYGFVENMGYYGFWIQEMQNGGYYNPTAIRGVDGVNIFDARDIEGSFAPADVRHNNREENAWVSNDGNVTTTWENVDVEFGYSQIKDLGDEETIAYADKTVINNVAFAGEHTLEADLQVEYANYDSAAGLTLRGNVASLKNDKLVDSYEIYMVSGKYTSVNDHEGFVDKVNGHTDAVLLDKYTNEDVNALAEGSADRTFDVTVPVAELNNTADGKFTLFAKANYKPEYNLEPTFHSMTPLEVEISTGVVNVAADVNAVRYYNLQGVEISNPEKGQVVIMRQGNKTSKIVVR